MDFPKIVRDEHHEPQRYQASVPVAVVKAVFVFSHGVFYLEFVGELVELGSVLHHFPGSLGFSGSCGRQAYCLQVVGDGDVEQDNRRQGSTHVMTLVDAALVHAECLAIDKSFVSVFLQWRQSLLGPRGNSFLAVVVVVEIVSIVAGSGVNVNIFKIPHVTFVVVVVVKVHVFEVDVAKRARKTRPFSLVASFFVVIVFVVMISFECGHKR
mmetsp:Transcript_10360/g.30298  ORF Transcript_10360/g.30298 Transcript_10360/m.30298 type:complete len:211 (+) Transcript_10360:238-870(+)